MIASLPMYAFASLDKANAEFWHLIYLALKARGVTAPAQLSAVGTAVDACFFTQTCGLPYRVKWHSKCHLLGTPDYGLPDSPAGYYYSHIIVHKDDPCAQIDDLIGAPWAANSYCSQSGYAALVNIYPELSAHRPVLTESHAKSVQAVAKKRARFAAIDAVSFRFLTAMGRTQAVRVIANTPPTPALPFVAKRCAPVEELRAALHGVMPFEPLGMKALVHIDQRTYLSIPTPPQSKQVLK